MESRNQKCTALFIRYLNEQKLIEYDEDFIDRITVYSEKDKQSDVDLRQQARYGHFIKDEAIIERYDEMMKICKQCIAQAEEIINKPGKPRMPEELKV